MEGLKGTPDGTHKHVMVGDPQRWKQRRKEGEKVTNGRYSSRKTQTKKYLESERQTDRLTDRQTYLPGRDEGDRVKEGTKKTGML